MDGPVLRAARQEICHVEYSVGLSPGRRNLTPEFDLSVARVFACRRAAAVAVHSSGEPSLPEPTTRSLAVFASSNVGISVSSEPEPRRLVADNSRAPCLRENAYGGQSGVQIGVRSLHVTKDSRADALAGLS